MMQHIPGCAQGEKVNCPANKSLHGEGVTEHWWSGWPGAFCLKCGAEDKDEVCISSGCTCPCHDEFWRQYEATLSSNSPEAGTPAVREDDPGSPRR